jgi:hypothetical protein
VIYGVLAALSVWLIQPPNVLVLYEMTTLTAAGSGEDVDPQENGLVVGGMLV